MIMGFVDVVQKQTLQALGRRLSCVLLLKDWGDSSVGRALEWHSRGQGFDSPYLHQFSPQVKIAAA